MINGTPPSSTQRSVPVKSMSRRRLRDAHVRSRRDVPSATPFREVRRRVCLDVARGPRTLRVLRVVARKGGCGILGGKSKKEDSSKCSKQFVDDESIGPTSTAPAARSRRARATLDSDEPTCPALNNENRKSLDISYRFRLVTARAHTNKSRALARWRRRSRPRRCHRRGGGDASHRSGSDGEREGD